MIGRGGGQGRQVGVHKKHITMRLIRMEVGVHAHKMVGFRLTERMSQLHAERVGVGGNIFLKKISCHYCKYFTSFFNSM